MKRLLRIFLLLLAAALCCGSRTAPAQAEELPAVTICVTNTMQWQWQYYNLSDMESAAYSYTQSGILYEGTVEYSQDLEPGWAEAEEALNALLQPRGYTVNRIFFPYTGLNPNYIRAGENMDLCINGATSGSLQQGIDEGFWLPLQELLPVYAPTLWAMHTPEEWAALEQDGQLYAVPLSQAGSDYGFAYRTDWAKQVGMEGVQGWSDLKTYLQRVYEAGLAQRAVSYYPCDWYNNPFFRSYMAETAGAQPISNDGVLKDIWMVPTKTGWELTDVWSLPESREYLREIREMAEKGWITLQPEGITGQNDYTFSLGYTALQVLPLDTYTGGTPGDPTARSWNGTWYGRKAPAAIGKSTAFTYALGTQKACITTNAATVAIPAAAQHPVEALELLEALFTDPEISRCANYGVSGVHYNTDTRGRCTRKGTDPAKTVFFGLTCGTGTIPFALPCDWDTADTAKVYESAAAECAVSPWGSFGSQFSHSLEMSQERINGEDMTTAGALLGDVWANTMPRLQAGQTVDPEAGLAAYLTTRDKAGFPEILAMAQRQYGETIGG